jgi:hypothetical protein
MHHQSWCHFVAGISGPNLVPSRKDIIKKIFLIGFGSFRPGTRNQSAVSREKSAIISCLHEIDGRTDGVTSTGEEANTPLDSIK